MGCGEWGAVQMSPYRGLGVAGRDPAPSMTELQNIGIPDMPCEFLPPSPTPQTAPHVPTLHRGHSRYKRALFPQGEGVSSWGASGLNGVTEASSPLADSEWGQEETGWGE